MSALPQTEAAAGFSESAEGISAGGIHTAVNQQDILNIFSENSGGVVRGACRFGQDFASMFPLFKGLSLLGRPSSLDLVFCAEEKAVYYQHDPAELGQIDGFFTTLIALLMKEVRFKKVLAEVIANKNRFKAEQSLLQKALMGE